LSDAGMTVYGGVHSPYVWVQAPEGYTSFDLFDKLLHEAHVVGTPGSGFGASGEGYFRISGFNSRANIEAAMDRIGSQLAV
jgi:LL-diaminopimelate aminotransferase